MYQDHVSAVRWLAMAVKNDFDFLMRQELSFRWHGFANEEVFRWIHELIRFGFSHK